MVEINLGTAESYLLIASDQRRHSTGDTATTNALIGIGVALCEIRDLMRETLERDKRYARKMVERAKSQLAEMTEEDE